MKHKLWPICAVILSFFCGVCVTYTTVNYVNRGALSNGKTEPVIQEIRNVTINDNGLRESVKKVYDAVVVVETYKNSSGGSSGTGFVYKTDDKYGYILTNQHVVDGGKKIMVTFNDGEYVEATVMGSDAYADIAVLRVNKDYVMQVAAIGSSEKMEIGDTVFTVGAPLGSEYSGSVTRGCISSGTRMVSVSLSNKSTSDWIMKVIQTDAAINPGNSGGPLVNINGEVIGINSMKLSDEEIEGIGFAIPIEDAMEYAAVFEKGDTIERPVIGIQMLNLTETYYLYMYQIQIDRDITSGVVIGGITKNTPAARADLQVGDVITKVNNEKVSNKAELRYELYKYKVGDEVTLELIRDGKTRKVTLRLEKAS